MVAKKVIEYECDYCGLLCQSREVIKSYSLGRTPKSVKKIDLCTHCFMVISLSKLLDVASKPGPKIVKQNEGTKTYSGNTKIVQPEIDPYECREPGCVSSKTGGPYTAKRQSDMTSHFNRVHKEKS